MADSLALSASHSSVGLFKGKFVRMNLEYFFRSISSCSLIFSGPCYTKIVPVLARRYFRPVDMRQLTSWLFDATHSFAAAIPNSRRPPLASEVGSRLPPRTPIIGAMMLRHYGFHQEMTGCCQTVANSAATLCTLLSSCMVCET